MSSWEVAQIQYRIQITYEEKGQQSRQCRVVIAQWSENVIIIKDAIDPDLQVSGLCLRRHY